MTLSAKSRALMCLTAGALVLAGCEKSAEGQVAAVVNSEEITLQEINAALNETNIPEGADKKKLQQNALQQIVERRLLAQAAKESGIDQDPAYLIRQRQLSEALLVQMYADKAGSTLKVPDQAAIDRYTEAHPFSFANRTVYAVDQIIFPSPANLGDLKKLEVANTLEDVQKILTEMGIQFARKSAQMDSVQVPPAMMAQIVSLDPGEPFVIPTGATVTASVIKAQQKVPYNADQAGPVAVKAIRNEEMAKIMKQRLAEAKTKAEITYQSGFEPAKDAGETAETPAAVPEAVEVPAG
ncbi:EpsD family peptidyl-prolyl cis-trans isomerase [Sphingorhabdus sp. Alg231-15]|uniref:EpsD family peptidyl-prolyl cis-trans isomerase n=1 Tax=Sphingorhabdus sp. Alg231-15 TaxID=1922222 RepID=UPI000D5569E1